MPTPHPFQLTQKPAPKRPEVAHSPQAADGPREDQMPTSFRDITSIPVSPFGVTFYVSNTTNPTEGQGSPGPTGQGRTPKNPFTTIQRAIDEAVSGRGDTIIIQRGTYTETLTINKAGLTLMGAVPYGYPDHVVVTGITTITSSNCSFYNLEFFSNSADAASTIVGTWSASVNSSWFENCSFASDGTTEPEVGSIVWGGNNHTYRNCRFIDNTFGLVLRSNAVDYVSHLEVLDCEFLENTTADITTNAIATAAGTSANTGAVNGPTVGLDQGVRNLRMERSFFGAGVTVPTDFINIVGASSGTMSGNVFGSATHASGTITIPAGIFYSSNAAEEGLTGAYNAAIGTSGRPD